jgi:predicted hotdog family 3-hydroxylacyl-ACP dehydratase
MIDQAGIRTLIPHAADMCLLESVVAWDDATITCESSTHRRANHPLQREGKLSSIHLVEYAAQAMAIHGGLVARKGGADGARPGMLTALRDCALHVERIDDVDGTLTIFARKLIAQGGSSMYQFEVSAQKKKLAEGRVSVITL